MKCYGIHQAIIWLAVGGVLCVAGGILYVFMPDIIDDIFALLLPLSQGSIIYPVWQEIPVPIYRKFYVFNYTNVDEYLAAPSSVQLNMTECGPYVYREVREKVFIQWNSDGETVNYRETHTYPYQPQLSTGSEWDVVTVPNIPLMTVLSLLLRSGSENSAQSLQYKEKLEDIIFNLKNLGSIHDLFFIDTNVTELIWSGYFDEMLQAQYRFLKTEILPADMFALFYGKNGTDDMEYKINRGTNDLSKQFEIITWDNSEYLDKYWTGFCSYINGSDGTMYNPKIEAGDRVYVFVSDICRSIFMDYLGEREYRGYTGHYFVSDGRLFADPGTNPDNFCFCGETGTDCLASGLANLEPCKGAPIFLSHPHMLYVDETIQSQTMGQDPVPEKHRSEVTIEPNSGMLLWIDIRFQINIHFSGVSNSSWISFGKTFPEIILPILWIDEAAQLDDARIEMLRDDLFIPMNIANAVPIVLMSLGAAAAAIGLSCMISLLWTQRSKERKLKKYNPGSDSTPSF